MQKTLIVFSTISGLNEEVAHAIAEALKTTYNMDATLADLRNGPPDITSFQNIIVGGGAGNSVYNEAVDFMENDFEGKNVALYFCCENKEDAKALNTEANQKKLLARNESLKPIDVSGFGGCMIRQGRTFMDDLNMGRVREWAIDLGKKLNTAFLPLNLINTVPFEKNFQFYIELGKNTGITASNTIEFAEKLQIVPIQSITFHFQRQDFQRWLKITIGDEELAKRIDQINVWTHDDENLRKELSETVQNRIAELTKS
jgi:menaquinone-dependent protoporphyrinogen IX oxidase